MTAPAVADTPKGALRRLLPRPLAPFGLIVIMLVFASAALAPFDPAKQHFDGLMIEGAPLPTNATFWLATDLLGRDLLSRHPLHRPADQTAVNRCTSTGSALLWNAAHVPPT
jgi:peptide/nickel transport system permease protein